MTNTHTDLRLQPNYPVWHPFTPLMGASTELEVVKAEREFLHLAGGRVLIDAVSSWWVNLHGHGHPAIAEAISKQASTLEHVIFAGFTHQPAVTLAQRILDILPGAHSKVFYSDNGSTAVEVALKMALQYWHNLGTPRTSIIALSGAYHGDTFGAMSVADRNPFNAPFAPLLFEVQQLDLTPTDDIWAPLDGSDQHTIQQMEKILAQSKPAAFIYEPLVQGSAGMRFYKAALLTRLLELAQQHQVITIADEIMTGFGRTGPLFASEHLTKNTPELSPDIICLSKGLTGGFLPLGVTTCKDHIQQAYRQEDIMATFFHGHSFTANPISCAAALASLDLLQADHCSAQRQQLSASLASFTQSLQAHPAIAHVRHLGCVLALEWKSSDKTGYFNEARHRLYQWCIDRNVLLRPLGNVLYIIPPYCISEDSLQRVYAVIKELLAELQ